MNDGKSAFYKRLELPKDLKRLIYIYSKIRWSMSRHAG
jgi:hypothetical protein